jgi:hypothetical protein
MSKDTTLVVRDSGGSKPNRLSPFRFFKFSDYVPYLFTTAPEGRILKSAVKVVVDIAKLKGNNAHLALGRYALLDGTQLIPQNAVYTGAYIDALYSVIPVLETPADISIYTDFQDLIECASDDLSAGAVLNGADFSFVISKEYAGDSNLYFDVSASLNSGKFVVVVEYFISETTNPGWWDLAKSLAKGKFKALKAKVTTPNA